MASPPVLDLESLLKPIDGENPAGEDIRLDTSPTSLYYRIKDARAAARAAERADLENTGTAAETWPTVIELAGEILATRAKDLEIAAWLIEGLVRRDGFAGLRDGFQLVAGLVKDFWGGLYPTPDEDGIVTRVAPLTGLNGEGAEGTLIQPISLIPLTQGSEMELSLWQYHQAVQIEKITEPDKKQWRLDQGAVSLDDFTANVRETPAASFTALVSDIEAALAAFGEMTAALDAAAGADSPPGSNIRGIIEKVLEAVRFFAADKLAVAEADAAADAPAAAEPGAGAGAAEGNAAGGARVPRDGYGSREDAFRDLQKIATYFRRNEPQSFISYTLEEVVRRGRLALPDLLKELIEDGTMRRQMLVAAGIKPPEEGSEGSA
jgi:type VI secretion system protein ImpA